jgi:hypothetical protein
MARPPVTPSNRLPSPIAIHIGCSRATASARLLDVRKLPRRATTPAFRPRTAILSTLALRNYGVPENVFNDLRKGWILKLGVRDVPDIPASSRNYIGHEITIDLIVIL